MQIAIYDTTLRDGTQREGISLSLADKLRITRMLDQMGIHYIEGGWPGSNPRDAAGAFHTSLNSSGRSP